MGQHGFKNKEQKRLLARFGKKVDGTTHESEHAIGFEVLNRGSGEQRGKGSTAMEIENDGMAYQEVKSLHRGHIGTGMKNQPDQSGFNSQSYRDTQRAQLEEGNPGVALQINQLGYAFLPHVPVNPVEQQQANESFYKMAMETNEVSFIDNGAKATREYSKAEKKELVVARVMTLLRRQLTPPELGAFTNVIVGVWDYKRLVQIKWQFCT